MVRHNKMAHIARHKKAYIHDNNVIIIAIVVQGSMFRIEPSEFTIAPTIIKKFDTG